LRVIKKEQLTFVVLHSFNQSINLSYEANEKKNKKKTNDMCEISVMY